MKRFTVKEEHIKLLKSACVDWDNCEFGAPCIDPKRPYGNSNVISDIMGILGESEKQCPHCGEPLNEADNEKYIRLHKETKIALQIFLQTGKMETGTYVKIDDYGIEWKKE